MPRMEASPLRMDTRLPYPCRSRRWVQRLPSRLVARDDEIIVNYCGLETLLIQVRSECVTLCFGELTRVCAYPPKFVLKSQDPRFHGDIESELLIPVCSVKDLDQSRPVSLCEAYHRSSSERKPRPKSNARSQIDL